MKIAVKKFVFGVASLMLVLFLTGCHSELAVTPIEKRAPGEDITPEARADKRGDTAVPGASLAAPSTGAPTTSVGK